MATDRNIDFTNGLRRRQGARKITVRRKIIYTLAMLALTYVIAETVVSMLYVRGIIEPVSVWLQEDTGMGSTIQFDPIRGYRLTSIPSRMAVVSTNGTIESVGTIRGNNEGFPDRDDFGPRRSHPKRKRFAVFGDSFTAAQFLSRNWPDAAEDLDRDSDSPLELLNFSVDGGGIVNWWSVLTRFVEPQGYEIDGVIFAVAGDDLIRGFAIWDDRITFSDDAEILSGIVVGIAYGQLHPYDSQSLPKTLEEAKPYLVRLDGWVTASSPEFNRLLSRDIRLPLFHRPIKLYLAQRLFQGTHRLMDFVDFHMVTSDIQVDEDTDPEGSSPRSPFNTSPTPRSNAAIKQLVDDIHRFLKSNRIPAMVVHVPSRECLLKGICWPSEKAQSFAAALEAEFVDGSLAFENLSEREIRASWLPYDAHWGQQGSDEFAQFMVNVLAYWPPSESASR